MCGISGIWGKNDKNIVTTMMDSLIHRGPDAKGLYISEKYSGVLGHRRLSIMDPEGGNQPLFNEDGSKAIIANGEIYNYPDLRLKLTQNHSVKTSSDTEAILHLYEDYGTQIHEYIDGMYAFAIADNDSLFITRDPIGIKPLYISEYNNAFLFASELKSFPVDCTHIQEFPPGSYFHTRTGLKTYYQVPEPEDQDISIDTCIKRIRSTLEKSIQKRLMSDVPLGAFLSGGLDSSIIAGIAKKYLGELHTFSVGIEGSRDLEAARIVSRHIGSIHHEYVITAREIQEYLPEIIYYLESYDQDLVRSAIPCFFTAKIASDYVKVILTGEGADELFGGYTYYKDIRDTKSLSRELKRSIESLHNINLQRVDRMTMRHSIEGRVPFLDLEMINLCLSIPPAYKLRGNPVVEKWILRKAFEDILPGDIVWREKEQFDEGSGTVDILRNIVDNTFIKKEMIDMKKYVKKLNLRTPEECLYFKIFNNVYSHGENFSDTIGRWALRPGYH